MSPARKHQPRVPLLLSLALGLMGASSGCDRGLSEKTDPLLHAVMQAEDARGRGPAGLGPLLEGVQSTDPHIQQVAVRGLGRLEDPSQMETISALLSSPTREVRAEAANALGQSVFNGPGDGVGAILRAHLPGESDPDVRGAMGRTLGRLRYETQAGLEEAETTLLEMTSAAAGDAPIPALLGAVMGFESLARRNRETEFSPSTIRRLEALTAFGLPTSGEEEAARIRRVSLMALAAARAATPEIIQQSLVDPDPDMRRLAVTAAGRLAPFPGGWGILDRLLADPNPRVRIQALTALGSQEEEDQRCPRLLSATQDPGTQVATEALDLLGQRCPATPDLLQVLIDFIQAPEASSPGRWHRAAHALTALAGLSPDVAVDHLQAFATHVNPFARSYGARAASIMGTRANPATGEPTAYATSAKEVLETLAQDPVPNVRTAAIQGLFRLSGHDIDGILLAQLNQTDPQLLQTAADFLRDTPNPEEAVRPLLQAFHHLSGEGKETLRDPRMAILNRLAQVGDTTVAGELEPYLTDYDPLVAERVATLLSDWTGQEFSADPEPGPEAPVPTPEELRKVAETRFLLLLEGGGEIELRLFPMLAPTNSARFARLARSGYFDGLTFHRVVPNFVLQGGSPAANELAGDGPYTRDEIGLLSNWRGTIGVSTRGRDTGDGQIFINLVDNLRLDHNYTLFGEVVGGMDELDQVVEGQVIESISTPKG